MKRFLVFSGLYHYQMGGFDDFDGSFDTLEEAKLYLEEKLDPHHGWADIVDTNIMEKVYEV